MRRWSISGGAAEVKVEDKKERRLLGRRWSVSTLERRTGEREKEVRMVGKGEGKGG